MSFTGGNISDTWKRWKQRWSLYKLASGASTKDEAIQCAIFLHVVGSEGIDIYNTFTFADGETDKITPLMEKFDAYCTPKKNITYERYIFNTRGQQAGETVDQYVTELKNMATTCEYGELRESLIRDRIVIGISDSTLRARLLRETDLDLAKATQMCRADEISKQQLKTLAGPSEVTRINEVRYGDSRKRTTYKKKIHDKVNHPESKEQTCRYCGYDVHKRVDCPARDEQCNNCRMKGHFAKVCMKKSTVHEVTADEEESKSYFLGSVESDVSEPDAIEPEPAWYTDLYTNRSHVRFKIDCGADVTVISEKTYRSMRDRPKLKQAHVKLDTLGGPLTCKGQFIARVQRNQHTVFVRMYVVNGDFDNLISRGDAVKLQLIARLDNVKSNKIYDLDVFGELGELKRRSVRIKVKQDAEPYCCTTARRVPFPLLEKVSEELERMERLGVIVKETAPTDWCSPMVVVPKSDGKLRICVDLKHLNTAIQRERYMLPTIDDILHTLADAQVFSKLDASSGYWQLRLHEDSSKLTTFITPFGRFRFLRLPFGICSASEIFQREMSEVLHGLAGVSVYQDDIIVSGKDVEEHDDRLKEVLNVIEQSGMKLNKSKCSIRKSGLEFLGHWIDERGVSPHADKIEAIQKMQKPKDVPELRRFLGMVNFLGRYVQDLAKYTAPLNELLRKENVWSWGQSQMKAFDDVKRIISTTPVLMFYDVDKDTAVCADASGFGLGAVLMQQDETDQWRPVAYASRTLTKAETGYAPIEKECLACTWACEKFTRYLLGKEKFTLWTDHKPLIPLINTRDIDQTPIRCQRLLLRMMRFNAVAKHVPGKDQVIADTLSRQPLECSETPDTVEEVQAYVHGIMACIQIRDPMIRRIRDATDADETLQKVIDYTVSGWPRHTKDIDGDTRELFHVRDELTVIKGLLVRNQKIVVPASMRAEILLKIHEGHQGVTKCRERANLSIWWPGLSTEINDFVKRCGHCQERRSTQRKEPLKSTPLPQYPWQKIGCDLCEVKGSTYIVMVDYYSRYIEIAYIRTPTTQSVILKMKDVFARWGVPETVVSDNGPQFASREFSAFATSAQFIHQTSSPHYPVSNGEAERAVQTAKHIIACEDPFSALQSYRATPIPSIRYSPTQLMMGRQIRTSLPTITSQFVPRWPAPLDVARNDETAKATYTRDYNKRNGARELTELQPGDKVRMKTATDDKWSDPATVTSRAAYPRSYIVEAENGGVYRRNRQHLLKVPHDNAIDASTPDVSVSSDAQETPATPGTPRVAKESSERKRVDRDQPDGEPSVMRRSSRVVVAPKKLDL